MTRFQSKTVSRATVPAPRAAIWALLTSPDTLAEMTPLLDHITVDGDRWTWQLTGISGLGVEVAPAFTEHMRFEPMHRIEYRHDPPPGVVERAGAEGVYELEAVDGHTTALSIDITLHVDLPLPSVSRRAVERVMTASMTKTGQVFGERLYKRLGLDPERSAADTQMVTA